MLFWVTNPRHDGANYLLTVAWLAINVYYFQSNFDLELTIWIELSTPAVPIYY